MRVSLFSTSCLWVVLSACFVNHNVVAGATVSEFSLPTVDGRTWSSSHADDAKLLVVAFIGTECPLMQLYGPRLEKLSQDYTPEASASSPSTPTIKTPLTKWPPS